MVTVLGTGSMGSAIAEGLLKAGRDVTVYNRTTEKTAGLAALGAKVANSAADAIAVSDLTIVVLPDAAATRELLLSGPTASALKGKRILNVAHTSAAEIIELAKDAADLGGAVSEVAVAAYPDPVRDCVGSFNLACDANEVDSWMPVLQDLGTVYFVGPVGNASKAEFALWLSYMFHAVAAAYSAAAFDKLGLPSDALLGALSNNPTLRIASAESMLPQMATRTYRQDSFSVDNFAHSVGLVIPEAEGMGLPTKLFKDIHELFTEASRLGFGSYDVSAVFEVIVRGGD